MFHSYRDTFRTPVVTNKEDDKQYFCDLCEDEEDRLRAWDFELDYEIHRRKAHKVELKKLLQEPNNHMCSVCVRPQSDSLSLKSHIKRHHLLSADSSFVKRDIFVCDYCNNIFFNKLLLVAHIKYYHLRIPNNRTLCPICNKNVLVRYVWFHFLCHGIHIGTCPICLKTFVNTEEALKHVESHPGYYMCNICMFESRNENLFQNHTMKHKKTFNISKTNIKAVSKFFIPQRQTSSWNIKFLNLFRGITLSPALQICVLCRAICETEDEMVQHIYGDHSAEKKVAMKKHTCTCGEEFFNSVLLKHHVFTFKGEHKDFNALNPVKSPKSDPLSEIEIFVDLDTAKKTAGRIRTIQDAQLPQSSMDFDSSDIKQEDDDTAAPNDIEASSLTILPDEIVYGDAGNQTVYRICPNENPIPKVYNTSKEYYEQALSLSMQENDESMCVSQELQYPDTQELVYEVVDDPNAEAGFVEETMYII